MASPRRSGLDSYNNTGRTEDVSSIFNLRGLTKRVPDID